MSVAAGAGTFIGVMVLPFQDASRGFLDPGPDWAEPPATQYVAGYVRSTEMLGRAARN